MLLCESILRFYTAPHGHDRAYNNLISDLEIADLFSYSCDLATHLMAYSLTDQIG